MSPKKIALLTDSCADLAPALAAENHIYTVPLRILCADGEYADGVDITAKEIYSRLRAGELPRPPCPKSRTLPRPWIRSRRTVTTAQLPLCSPAASPAPIT